MKKTLFSVLIFSFVGWTQAQKIEHVAPTHWWTNMKHHQIEILVHSKDIAHQKVTLKNNPHAKLLGTSTVKNPNYVFLQVDILPNAQPTTLEFSFENGASLSYHIKAKKEHKGYGIDASDVLYLITPDRFANGDTSNDAFADMQETIVDRDSIVARHGGDLQGVINKLPYIKSLGVTATWLNPVNENDQHFQSYHGYGITDQYTVDKRFGGNEVYREYVNKSHEMGLKVVNDVVYNHIGVHHYLWKDKPGEDWFHPKKASNYRATALMDPYAADLDIEKEQNGWFSDDMPDLNQENKHVANYLIQHAIWWIQEFGVDAYRVDTFAYPDQLFMKEWANAIYTEYPGFTIFAEIWDTGEPTQAWFTQGKRMNEQWDNLIPGITDFELQYAMMDTCNEEFGWNTGIMKIYYTLAFDFLYDDPMANVIFLDNHDINRFLGSVDNNVECLKMNTAFLLTTRGIPQYYYGTEVLMNQTGHHGEIRADFEGGWNSDKKDKFTQKGRTKAENDYFEYTQKLMNWRKNATAIHNGKLKHFVPEDGVYVYFRYNDAQTIMVIMNSNKTGKEISLERYTEALKGFSEGIDVISEKKYRLNKAVKLDAQSTIVLELE